MVDRYLELERKAAILLSRENKINKKTLQKLGSQTSSVVLIKNSFDVEYNTLKTWAVEPQKVHAKSIEKIVNKVNAGRKRALLKEADFSELSAFDFGSKLGMYREQVQKAMDEWIDNKARPDIRYYLSKNQAEDILKNYGGVYSVILPVHSKETEVEFMCCTLRVRYYFRPESKGDTYAVRVKLNVPYMVDNPNDLYQRHSKYYNYVGKMTERRYKRSKNSQEHFRCHWYFEQKYYESQYNHSDFINIMALELDNEQPHILGGLFMSVNQDEDFHGYASPVYIRKNLDVNNEPEEKDGQTIDTQCAVDFMENETDVFSSIEKLSSCYPDASNYFIEKGYKEKGDLIVMC